MEEGRRVAGNGRSLALSCFHHVVCPSRFCYLHLFLSPSPSLSLFSTVTVTVTVAAAGILFPSVPRRLPRWSAPRPRRIVISAG